MLDELNGELLIRAAMGNMLIFWGVFYASVKKGSEFETYFR